MAKKKGKKQAKKKPAKRRASEPVIVPEKVLSGLIGKEVSVGTELLELGAARGPFSDVRSQQECRARGGIVKRPPPWSRLSFVCAMPPPWAKTRHERPVPGLMGCEGGSMGSPAFVSATDRCAPGYVKVRTAHPRWGTGEFYMCVLPGTIPRITPRGSLFGLGQGLLPGEISFPMVIVGNLVGVGAGTAVKRLLPALDLSPAIVNAIKIAMGGGGAALYFVVKKSFPLGFALGTLPGAVEAVIDFIAGPIEKAAGGGAKALTGRSMGQLEPAQIRELEEMAEEMSGDFSGMAAAPEEIEEEPTIPATFF